MSQASVTAPPARRRGGIAVFLTIGVAFLAGAGAAQAAITTSNITAPADGTVLLDDLTSSSAQTFTVSGTSNGTAGDAVDIACYEGGAKLSAYQGGAGNGVAVQAGGAFAATVPMSTFAGDSCELVAVPHATGPNPPTGFTGPRIGVGKYNTAITGGTMYDYYLNDETPSAATGFYSSGSCGPFSRLYDDSASMNFGPSLFDCAGNLYTTSAFYASGFDLTRSGVLVDGANAYNSFGAWDENGILSGFPALTATLDAFDSAGDAQTTESESLVKCSPSDGYPPSSCTSYVSAGVKMQRVSDITSGGRVTTQTDTYTSTDGASHALDLEYETDLFGSVGGWELPGESSFTQRATGATGAAPGSSPGTLYAISNTTQSPGLDDPVGALTFGSPYNALRFDNTLFGGYTSALFDYQRTVPAGGSVTIQWSYAVGASLAEVQGYAAAAQDLLVPPTIAIASPGNGAALTSTPATVTGTATASTGVKGVTVDGVAAAVSAGKFSASVPLTLGSNTIKATVTTNSGATKSASETVSYTGPAPVVTTGGASRIGSSTAKVSGTVTPGATAGTYYFQYGKTSAYGHPTPAKPLAAGTSASSVSATLGGLASHATYHYRRVATNGGGTSYGTDRTFTTLYALRGLTIKVSRRGAHSYRVTGALKLPQGLSRAQGCKGTVTVTVRRGHRTLGSHPARVTKRCTYSESLPLHLKRGGKLRVAAAFGGNGLIGPFPAHF